MKYILLALLLCSLTACDTASYSWNEVNQIAMENDQILIAGSKTGISKTAGIKSPYIYIYDFDLSALSNKYYPTTTTALNPSFTKLNDGSSVLYFYKAESPDLQTEHSHLLFLNEEFNITDEKRFGHRTRITEFQRRENDWVSYQYEREKLNCSVSNFVDSVQTDKKSFALSKESNIPTDMILQGDSSIYIAAIANGFHHRDGHQYLNEKAYDFILMLDEKFEEQKRYIADSEQHSFVNDLLLNDKAIISTGTEQNDSTGMDVKIQGFSLELEENWKYVHQKAGAQKGIKSIGHNDQIFTLGETYNPSSKKNNLFLLQLDKTGTVVEMNFERDVSYGAKDMIVVKDHLYIIASKQSSRISEMESVILKVDLQGKLIQEKTIQ